MKGLATWIFKQTLLACLLGLVHFWCCAVFAQTENRDNHISLSICKATDANLTSEQCAMWARRATYIRQNDCSGDAYSACSSFRELVNANDVDLMDDLAEQDHIYICFRPNEDVFLEVSYSDVNNGVWERDAKTGQATHWGGAGVLYYKDGIGSGDMSIHNTGQWVFSISRTQNVDAIRSAPANAIFHGGNILIQGSRFQADETYKNSAGIEITHRLIVQLSTGRFIETYDGLGVAKSANSYSGRCLVLPSKAM